MPDLPADPSTPATVAVGETLTGVLETRGDTDWVRIDLTGGETIRVVLRPDGEAAGAGPITDPFLTVYGPRGHRIDQNDDGAAGLNSALIFTAPATGSYYLEAGTYRPRDTGGWEMKVTRATPPTDPTASIDWGGETLPSREISVYFTPDGVREGRYTSEGFTDYEKARFEAAFRMIEAVADVRFTVTDDPGADLRLVLDTDEVDGEFLGFFNPPGTRGAGRGVFDGAQWMRDPAGAGDLDAGGYAFVTITHELLHGLGLAHPHDNGGGSEVMWQVGRPKNDYGAYDLNQGIFTTMSYNTGFFTGGQGTRGDRGDFWGYEAGPMALDIAVLQEKYGANPATGSGDDTYLLPRGNQAGTFWQAIWDTGGEDTVATRGPRDAVIDLRAATLAYEAGGGGFVSSAARTAGGFTIAAGVTIENALGGGGDDILTGNAAGNRLSGRGGADILAGGAGADTLSGGRGADHFVFDLSDLGTTDRIADFGRADRIDLSGLGTPLTLIGAAAFGGQAGEVRVAATGGTARIEADLDGDGTADFSLVVAGAVPGADSLLL